MFDSLGLANSLCRCYTLASVPKPEGAEDTWMWVAFIICVIVAGLFAHGAIWFPYNPISAAKEICIFTLAAVGFLIYLVV